MARHSSPRGDEAQRARVAQEAARIMAEEGVRDFLAAKRKAVDRLGLSGHRRYFPSNLQVEDALAEYQRLFRADAHGDRLRELRECALRAMELFRAFSPRLVGPVMSGLVGRHAEVALHLFADPPEEVVVFLMQHGIPFESGERRLRRASGVARAYPVFRFMAGEEVIDATVFAIDEIREAPASPVDGRPMKRGSLRELEALLAGDGEQSSILDGLSAS